MDNKERIAYLEAAIREADQKSFDNYVKEAKSAVQKEAITRFGFSHSSQLAKVAWWMAEDDLDHEEFIVGTKKNTPEAYTVVNQIRDDAKRFVSYMYHIRLLRGSCGSFDEIEVRRKRLAEESSNQVNNTKEVLDQKARYKRKERLQKCKKYLKLAVCFLLGMSFGFVCGNPTELLLLCVLFALHLLLTA